MPDGVVLKDLIVRFRADLRGFDAGIQKLNAAIDQQQKVVQSRYGAMAAQVRGLGAAMTVGLTAPIMLAGKAIVSTVMEMDSMEAGLVAVMGSADAAKKELKELVNVAKLPGLGIKEAVKGSVGLQAAGMSADMARKSLLEFGNALATVGKGKAELDAVNTQLIQMAGSEKVLTEDIKIIKTYIPQFSKAMRDAFGSSNAEEIQKMGISTHEFIRVMTEELGKIPRVAKGMKGSWEDAMDSMTMAMVNFKGVVAPIVIAVSKIIEVIADRVKNLGSTGTKVLAGLAIGAASLGPLMLALSGLPQLIAGVSIALKGLRAAWLVFNTSVMASNPIGWVVLGLTAVVALFLKFRNQLGFTDNRIKEIGQTIRKNFVSVWNQLKPAIQSVKSSVDKLRDSMKPFVDVILKLVGKACLYLFKYYLFQIQIALKAIIPVINVVIAALSKYFSVLSGIVDKMRELIGLQALAEKSMKGFTMVQLLSATAIAGVTEAGARKAVIDKKRTNEMLSQTKERIGAIKDEIAAERERAIAQAGFSSLQGMWQKQMEAGAKERFSTIITGVNKGRELAEAEKQTRLLDKTIDRLDKLINTMDKAWRENRASILT